MGLIRSPGSLVCQDLDHGRGLHLQRLHPRHKSGDRRRAILLAQRRRVAGRFLGHRRRPRPRMLLGHRRRQRRGVRQGRGRTRRGLTTSTVPGRGRTWRSLAFGTIVRVLGRIQPLVYVLSGFLVHRRLRARVRVRLSEIARRICTAARFLLRVRGLVNPENQHHLIQLQKHSGFSQQMSDKVVKIWLILVQTLAKNLISPLPPPRDNTPR